MCPKRDATSAHACSDSRLGCPPRTKPRVMAHFHFSFGQFLGALGHVTYHDAKGAVVVQDFLQELPPRSAQRLGARVQGSVGKASLYDDSLISVP
jgi:hypothetical protein